MSKIPENANRLVPADLTKRRRGGGGRGKGGLRHDFWTLFLFVNASATNFGPHTEPDFGVRVCVFNMVLTFTSQYRMGLSQLVNPRVVLNLSAR